VLRYENFTTARIHRKLSYQKLTLISWVTEKMAVHFDVTITENYGYVHDFEKVKGIIQDHELTTTTKFALFKAPKDFGRKGKLAILKRASVLQYEYSVVQT